MKEARLLKMDLKKITSIGGVILGHELVEKLLGLVFEGVQKHGAKFIHSNILGLGTNDEALFNSAIAYAIFGLGANPEKMIIVLDVINSYGRQSKSRIIQIIGKDEQSVTIEVPALNENKEVITDKKGKPLFKKETIVANVRGAQTLHYWSTLTKEQVKTAIEAGNMHNPLGDAVARAMSSDNIKRFFATTYDATKNGYDSLGSELLRRDNPISRWADKFRK
ncbi:MAG: hypothetical protein PHG95_00105 [Patescibacteria group bacterium]|nr:hypothetical protein [Patescibacteria group bacterium]